MYLLNNKVRKNIYLNIGRSYFVKRGGVFMNFKFIFHSDALRAGVRENNMKRCIIPLLISITCLRCDVTAPAARSNPRFHPSKFYYCVHCNGSIFQTRHNKETTINFTYNKKRKTQCIISLSVVLSSIYSNQT